MVVSERMLADLDGRPSGSLSEPSQQALAHVPHAAQWARDFTRDLSISTKAFRLRSAPFTVHSAAEGIARACIQQPDDMLRDLLIGAIDEFAAWSGRHVGPATTRDTATAAAARRPAQTAVAH